MTIEDPVEFTHQHQQLHGHAARGRQRHARASRKALRSVLRQDPDFVLVGELRDHETIEAALTLAETGHLTFGTLHTSDAVQTINRIIDVFPAHQQQQVRTQLSFTLEAVFCQQLLPLASGRGRAMAAEIMLATPAIRALIREGKAHQIYSQIQTGGRAGHADDVAVAGRARALGHACASRTPSATSATRASSATPDPRPP